MTEDHYRRGDPETGCAYLMLAGVVGLLFTVAGLVLLFRSPAAFFIILILVVAMVAAAAGAIWLNRRVNR